MSRTALIHRLSSADPGWDLWADLISLVKSLEFTRVVDEYLGIFFVSGSQLTFGEFYKKIAVPSWLPQYVLPLYGMKADRYEMAGGYADRFCGRLAVKGGVFSPGGNDEECGYPLIDVPPNLYAFQSNASGAEFFIDTQCRILYPNSDNRCFEILDGLEEFTKKNIRQVLAGKRWFGAYKGLKGALLD